MRGKTQRTYSPVTIVLFNEGKNLNIWNSNNKGENVRVGGSVRGDAFRYFLPSFSFYQTANTKRHPQQPKGKMCSPIAVEASRLNNKGAELLDTGLYEDAITAFSEGMTFLVVSHNRAAAQDAADDDDAPRNEANFTNTEGEAHTDGRSHTKNAVCHFYNIDELEIVGATPEAEERWNDDETFVFTAPLCISMHQDHDATVSAYSYYHEFSFILVYNLALAYHLSGLDGGIKESRLRKAVSLYEQTSMIQMTNGLQLTGLQTMALVNNLGQVHVVLGNASKSERCFRHLISVMMAVKESDQRDSVRRVEGFIHNVTHLILEKTGTATAA